MIKEIEKEFTDYANSHEEMHSEILEWRFKIVGNIYLTLFIGKAHGRDYSKPTNMVNIKEYERIDMGLYYKRDVRFSPFCWVKLKALYEETYDYDNGTSPFGFIFDENLKPYQVIERLSVLIQENTEYQTLIKQLGNDH